MLVRALRKSWRPGACGTTVERHLLGDRPASLSAGSRAEVAQVPELPQLRQEAQPGLGQQQLPGAARGDGGIGLRPRPTQCAARPRSVAASPVPRQKNRRDHSWAGRTLLGVRQATGGGARRPGGSVRKGGEQFPVPRTFADPKVAGRDQS
jgi:hypothetical protein